MSNLFGLYFTRNSCVLRLLSGVPTTITRNTLYMISKYLYIFFCQISAFIDEDEVCDYNSEDYDFEQCETVQFQNQCKTEEGIPCVFPFTFRGRERTSCITGKRRIEPWCPTQVDSVGFPVDDQWGNCDDNCHTEGKFPLKYF